MRPLIFSAGSVMAGLGAIASGAIANDAIPLATSMQDLPLPAHTMPLSEPPSEPQRTVAQVLPREQFTDVAPTHWAYTAVDTLTNEYGCLSGYPDGTFRGEQLVTRYEFAVAMEACLDGLLQQIGQGQPAALDDILNDLEELNRELGTLSDDADSLAP